jgi:hypothetical protein
MAPEQPVQVICTKAAGKILGLRRLGVSYLDVKLVFVFFRLMSG